MDISRNELDLAKCTFSPLFATKSRVWMLPGMECGDSPYADAFYEVCAQWFSLGYDMQTINIPMAWDSRALARNMPSWHISGVVS